MHYSRSVFAHIKCKCVWEISSASKMLLSPSTFASLHIVEPLCTISIRADRISCQHRCCCRCHRRHFMLQNIILAHFLLLFYFSGFSVVEFFFRHLFSGWIHAYYRSGHIGKCDSFAYCICGSTSQRVWIPNVMFLTESNAAKKKKKLPWMQAWHMVRMYTCGKHYLHTNVSFNFLSPRHAFDRLTIENLSLHRRNPGFHFLCFPMSRRSKVESYWCWCNVYINIGPTILQSNQNKRLISELYSFLLVFFLNFWFVPSYIR